MRSQFLWEPASPPNARVWVTFVVADLGFGAGIRQREGEGKWQLHCLLYVDPPVRKAQGQPVSKTSSRHGQTALTRRSYDRRAFELTEGKN